MKERLRLLLKKIIDNLYIWVGVVVMMMGLALIVSNLIEYKKGQDVYQVMRENAYISVTNDNTAEEMKNPEMGYEEKQKDGSENNIDFDKLQSVNPDIVGWIKIENSKIDYPIVKGDTNEEYLDKAADGTQSKCGSLFLDASRNENMDEWNILIHGHNMKDRSMFGSLKNYMQEEEYYNHHKYIMLYTPEKVKKYKIISYYTTNETDEIYYPDILKDKDLFVSKVEQNIKEDIASIKKCQFLTLSTCSTTGKRFVVHAVQCEN